MARVICFASGKGGVGKTTLVANIGIALAESNQKVLLVDADIAMANLSLILGLSSSPITLHDVLLDESTSTDAIYESLEGVFVMPSSLSIESYQKIDNSRLSNVIDSVRENFDFILIDAGAGIEKNVLSAMQAADEVMLVITPDTSSIADALKTRDMANKIGAKPNGIIVNFLGINNDEIPVSKIIKVLELPAFGEVPYDTEVRKTFTSGKSKPIIIRQPANRAAKAFKDSAARILRGNIDNAQLPETKKQGFFQRLLNFFMRKKE